MHYHIQAVSINDVVLAGHSALTPPLPGRDIVADLIQATAITEECLANSANIATAVADVQMMPSGECSG
jgi:hypothetical protein